MGVGGGFGVFEVFREVGGVLLEIRIGARDFWGGGFWRGFG